MRTFVQYKDSKDLRMIRNQNFIRRIQKVRTYLGPSFVVSLKVQLTNKTISLILGFKNKFLNLKSKLYEKDSKRGCKSLRTFLGQVLLLLYFARSATSRIMWKRASELLLLNCFFIGLIQNLPKNSFSKKNILRLL